MSAALTVVEQQRSGIAAHALISLGLHLNERRDKLAAPKAQHLPDSMDDRLTIEVCAADADAWAQSLTDVSADTMVASDGRFVRHVEGQLPDSCLRVRIIAKYPTAVAS